MPDPLNVIERYVRLYVEELVLPCSRAIADCFGETAGWMHFLGATATVPALLLWGLELLLVR